MFKLISLNLIVGLSVVASSARADTLFDVNLSYDNNYSVFGTLTTDGAATLTANDIVAYDLTANTIYDGIVIHATNLGSSEIVGGKTLFSDQTNDLTLKGTALTSDGKNLIFDFASTDYAELDFYDIQFWATYEQLVISGKGGHYDDPIIGTVATTPLPSSFPLFAAGAAFVLLLSNRKKLIAKSEAFRAA